MQCPDIAAFSRRQTYSRYYMYLLDRLAQVGSTPESRRSAHMHAAHRSLMKLESLWQRSLRADTNEIWHSSEERTITELSVYLDWSTAFKLPLRHHHQLALPAMQTHSCMPCLTLKFLNSSWCSRYKPHKPWHASSSPSLGMQGWVVSTPVCTKQIKQLVPFYTWFVQKHSNLTLRSLGVRQLPTSCRPGDSRINSKLLFTFPPADNSVSPNPELQHFAQTATRTERERPYILTSSLQQPGPWKKKYIYTHTCRNIQLRLCTV
jgi:hypothetical protein